MNSTPKRKLMYVKHLSEKFILYSFIIYIEISITNHLIRFFSYSQKTYWTGMGSVYNLLRNLQIQCKISDIYVNYVIYISKIWKIAELATRPVPVLPGKAMASLKERSTQTNTDSMMTDRTLQMFWT